MSCLRPPRKNHQNIRPEKERELCLKCLRPGRVCLCEHITPLSNQTCVGILQHPNEHRKTFNTARIAHLALENSFLEVGCEFDSRNSFQERLQSFQPQELGILFPSPEAIPLEEARSKVKCLLVLDGTWSEAKKLYMRNDCLKHVQHYAFTPTEKSRYTLRKEPQDHYVCTIEAIAYALADLEPSLNSDHLHQLLQEQVKLQSSFSDNSRHMENGRHRSIRKKIAKLHWQLYSTNNENKDITPMLAELKLLQKQLENEG